MPLGQDQYLTAHRLHLAEDVAGQNDRMGLAQFLNESADLNDLRRVKAHGGLIQNDELRCTQQCLRNAHTLAVALGQAADEPGQNILQPGAAGGTQHLFFALCFLFDALELCRKVQILLHGHFRIERRLLGQVAHTGLGLLRLFRQTETRHLNFAAGGCKVAGEDIHNRRFSGAIGPQQAEDLTVTHCKGQILNGRVCAVFFAQMRYFDHSKRSFIRLIQCWYILDGKCVKIETILW